MKIHQKYFSDKLKDKYNLHDEIADDRYVYCHIKKVCTGLNKLHV